jgi:hypothetical protein
MHFACLARHHGRRGASLPPVSLVHRPPLLYIWGPLNSVHFHSVPALSLLTHSPRSAPRLRVVIHRVAFVPHCQSGPLCTGQSDDMFNLVHVVAGLLRASLIALGFG